MRYSVVGMLCLKALVTDWNCPVLFLEVFPTEILQEIGMV